MFKLTLRNIRGRKLRYALTTFAVVLGVAFLSTSFFLTDRIRETFDDLALDIVGEADLAVRASFGDGDRRNQDQLIEFARALAPRVQTAVRSAGSDSS